MPPFKVNLDLKHAASWQGPASPGKRHSLLLLHFSFVQPLHSARIMLHAQTCTPSGLQLAQWLRLEAIWEPGCQIMPERAMS